MTASEINANNDNSDTIEKSLDTQTKKPRSIKSSGITLPFNVPKEAQIIIEQTINTTIFILADMFVVWLTGQAFGDFIQKIAFINLMYNGIKIASALIIAIRYLANCIIEIQQAGKKVKSELREKQAERY